jgi:hypothetical protein
MKSEPPRAAQTRNTLTIAPNRPGDCSADKKRLMELKLPKQKALRRRTGKIRKELKNCGKLLGH